MGFVDGVLNYFEDETKKRNQALKHTSKMADRMSDEKLFRAYKNAHGYDKLGYKQELIKRGYGKNN